MTQITPEENIDIYRNITDRSKSRKNNMRRKLSPKMKLQFIKKCNKEKISPVTESDEEHV